MELGYTPYNLRTLRNRCKLTQAELAQIVGVKHYIQVGRWEAEPDTETMAAVPRLDRKNKRRLKPSECEACPPGTAFFTHPQT